MLFVSAKAAAKVRLPVSGGSAGAPAVEVQASPHVLKLEKVALAAFSPDGKTLMTVGDVDRQVHFWSTDNGEEVNRFGVAVTNAVFSADGSRVLTSGTDDVVRVFDARTGKALRRLERVGKGLRAMAISPDGSRAVTSTFGGSADVRLWDTASGQPIGKALDSGPAPVAAVTFTADGARAVTLTGKTTPAPGDKEAAAALPLTYNLTLWDLATQQALRRVPDVAGQWVYVSNNGKLALVGAENQAILYDLETGRTVPATRSPDETFPPGQFSADRKTGLWKAIGNAAITDAITGEQVRKLEGPIDGLPICNAFSADGGKVILGTGKAELFSRNPEAPGGVYVYEVSSGRRLAAFTGHPREVRRVAFDAAAAHAYSLDASKTLFLWAIPKQAK